jgi:hypothetical protein
MMLTVFLIIAVMVVALVAISLIALVIAHKTGLIDDNTYPRYAHIATIVGLPLAVIGAIGATVTIAALLFRDRPPPPPPPASPSPTIEVLETSPHPMPSSSIPLFPTEPPTALPSPTMSPVPQQPQDAAGTRPTTTSQDPVTTTTTTTATPVRYDRGDIGTKKDNGYYEITLQNAKTEPTCMNGYARVSNQEKLITITFSIRAAHLDVPSIATSQDVDTYYIEDTEGRRYQMSCGDGRYFNVSLNSFDGKPKPKTLTVSFVVPITAQGLRFRFSPSAGDAVVLTLPSPL